MPKNKIVKIVQAKSGNPVLRDFAEQVPLEEIKSEKIKKIIEEMKNALAIEEEGVAIGAPQISIPLRIFIVSKKIFQLIDAAKSGENKFDDLIFIKPKIIKLSKEKE